MALEPLPASRDDEPASGAQAAPVAETAHAAAGDGREAGATTP